MQKRAVVVLAEGFEEIEAISVIDVLRRAGVAVVVAGLHGELVRGAHDITVKADSLFDRAGQEFDAIILPGGMPGAANLAASGALLEVIREAFGSGKLCAAICAAPSVLGKAGILTGRRATCYPGFEEKLGEGRFEERAVVVDGNVITSRGVGTAVYFALEVAAYLTGREAAKKVGSALLFPEFGEPGTKC